MRFTIKREQFTKALSMASRAIPNAATNALLLNYRLEVTSKGLEITSSNGNISIWTYIPFEMNGEEVLRDTTEGAILANARFLNDVVHKLDSDEITFEVIDGTYARLIAGKSEFKLTNCQDAEEYPDIDLEPAGNSFTLPAPHLTELVDETAFAAASAMRLVTDVLRAVNLKAVNGQLIAIATDGARVSRKSIPCDEELMLNANVPADALKEIVKMFDGVSEVSLSATEDRAVFSFGNTVAATRLISGNYPFSDSVIPKSFTRYLDVSSRQLIAAIERVSAMTANEKTRVVRLTMEEESVVVSSSSDTNGSAKESIETFEFNGEPLSIAFNADFVIAAIRALGSESITISFAGEMKPFIVRNPDDEAIVELITPMRTR